MLLPSLKEERPRGPLPEEDRLHKGGLLLGKINIANHHKGAIPNEEDPNIRIEKGRARGKPAPNFREGIINRVMIEEGRDIHRNKEETLGHNTRTPEPRTEGLEINIGTPELRIKGKEINIGTPEPRIKGKEINIGTPEPRIEGKEINFEESLRVNTTSRELPRRFLLKEILSHPIEELPKGRESLNINKGEKIIALTAEGRYMGIPQAVFCADGAGNQMIEDNHNMRPRGEKLPAIKIHDIKGSLQGEVPLQVGNVRLITR